MSKKLGLLSVIFILPILFTQSVQAWVDHFEVLAQAEPDECYAGVGEPYPEGPPCPGGSTEKTNQSYVWSLTQAEDSLWFGTGANIFCTTQGAFFSEFSDIDTSGYVCEYGKSQIAQTKPGFPSRYGDWRPGKIYEYDLSSRQLIDRTPRDRLLYQSLGLRSAGSHNGVVFLAGGTFQGTLAMFAFDATTKAYLGSREFTDFRTCRKWVVVNNILYAGMGAGEKGRILRWFGNRDDLWNFRVVGVVNGVPRELAEYVDAEGNKRLVVSSVGVWVSPAIPPNTAGLLPKQYQEWKEVWNPALYEPDIVTRSTYAGGGIFFFDGWVYFGTMHIPGNAMNKHRTCTAPACFGNPRNGIEYLRLINGTWRATSIWRIRDLESSMPEIQLLYGEASLPALTSSKTFTVVPNVGNFTPLYGSSGFGNTYNNYSWVMTGVDGRLFVGTMDASNLFRSFTTTWGADLYRFDNSDSPAKIENGDGFGNQNNYGIRCLIPSPDGTKLFAGMANPMNLKLDGGWSLIQLNSDSAF
jgi:hypothetical protein